MGEGEWASRPVLNRRQAEAPVKVVHYQPHVITYLDILGFQEIVATRTAGFVSKLIRIVQEATRPSKWAKEGQDIRYQNFSDLCVIATPIKTKHHKYDYGGLFTLELLGLVHAQVALLSEEIFVRGAITIGPLVRSHNVLYGPGLVSAYRLEQSAIYPRIVVDPHAIDVVRKDSGLWVHDSQSELDSIGSLVRRDADDALYVDYLRAIEGELDTPEYEYPGFLAVHKKLIRENLSKYSDDPKINAKYVWLARYHDATVRERLLSKDWPRYLVSPQIG
jgi:hypothetical protein